MARLQGIAGGLSGKMGSVVFRQRGGQTIASQYQPIVANPKSAGQQDARVKFKLMTQLAAIMAGSIGTMGKTERPARMRMTPRNRFFQLNYPLVDVVETADGIKAKIAMERLQLTDSFRAFSPEMSASLTYNENEATTTLVAKLSSIQTSITHIRFIVISYASTEFGVTETSQAYVVSESTIAVTIDAVTNKPTCSLNETLAGDHTYVTLLAYGLIPTSETSRTNLDNILTNNNEPFVSQVQLNSLVSNGAFEESVTAGVNIEL